MKKLFFLLLVVTFLVGCKSTYNPSFEPRVAVEKNMLTKNSINTIESAYINFSSSATLHKVELKKNVDTKETVSGGIIYSESVISGLNFYLNSRIPVFYDKGPKKGEIVYLNGKKLTTPLLAEVISFEKNKKDEIEQINVSIDGTLGVVTLPFYIRFNDSENFFIKLTKKDELESFDTSNLKIDKYNYLYFLNNGIKFFIIQGGDGKLWGISESESKLSLDKCFIHKNIRDETEKNIAKSKVIGQ